MTQSNHSKQWARPRKRSYRKNIHTKIRHRRGIGQILCPKSRITEVLAGPR